MQLTSNLIRFCSDVPKSRYWLLRRRRFACPSANTTFTLVGDSMIESDVNSQPDSDRWPSIGDELF